LSEKYYEKNEKKNSFIVRKKKQNMSLVIEQISRALSTVYDNNEIQKNDERKLQIYHNLLMNIIFEYNFDSNGQKSTMQNIYLSSSNIDEAINTYFQKTNLTRGKLVSLLNMWCEGIRRCFQLQDELQLMYMLDRDLLVTILNKHETWINNYKITHAYFVSVLRLLKLEDDMLIRLIGM